MSGLKSICRWLFLSLSLIVLMVNAARAEAFQPDEVALLENTLTQFKADMTALNFEGVLKVMPPKIWTFVKKNTKLDDEQLMAAVSQAMMQTLSKVEIVDFSMNAAIATTHQLADGQMYMLVPTETRMRVEAGKIYAVRSSTLALYENKKWYLVRINDPQQRKILGAVYPSFNGVEFPEEKTETVEE